MPDPAERAGPMLYQVWFGDMSIDTSRSPARYDTAALEALGHAMPAGGDIFAWHGETGLAVPWKKPLRHIEAEHELISHAIFEQLRNLSPRTVASDRSIMLVGPDGESRRYEQLKIDLPEQWRFMIADLEKSLPPFETTPVDDSTFKADNRAWGKELRLRKKSDLPTRIALSLNATEPTELFDVPRLFYRVVREEFRDVWLDTELSRYLRETPGERDVDFTEAHASDPLLQDWFWV